VTIQTRDLNLIVIVGTGRIEIEGTAGSVELLPV
jgi:hypothetical protein